MTGTPISDLSIIVKQRQYPCVLDPKLALSIYGLPLVKQLGELMELWVVREFWHMLDNTQFYQSQPESLISLPPDSLLSEKQQILSQHVVRSLQEWERLRLRVDPNNRKINFLADVIGESCVPLGTDRELIWRWESLAQNLDHHLGEPISRVESLALAYRDLAALAAARPACILTHRSIPEATDDRPPEICETLEQWGISCHEVNSNNSIVDIERSYFRNLLVHAGLGKLLWAGLDLVVLHLVVPIAATLSVANDSSEEYSFFDLENSIDLSTSQDPQTNFWEGAQGFWYCL